MQIRTFVATAVALALAATAGAANGNGKIAYVRDGWAFVANADGSGETKIAEDAHPDTPIWSPDGAHVAYLQPTHRPDVLDEIVPVVASADGSGATQLAPDGQFTLACWLGPSTLVARRVELASTNPFTLDYDLYAFGLDGTTRRLTDDGAAKSVSPQGCAPDGTEIAYSVQQPDYKSKAFVVAADGSGLRQLTPPGFSDSAPAWSPAGDKLAFLRTGVDPGLYVSDPAGNGATRLTTRAGDNIRWSPDANELLFTYRYTDYSRCSRYGCQQDAEVHTIGVDASNERVVAGTGYDEARDWSPDGTKIAFSRASRSFVMNRDGSCKTVLPANVPPSFAWQPVPGALGAPRFRCADLAVSTDVQYVDLPKSASTSYTITVTNQGNEGASAVALDQPPGHNIVLTAVSSSQGTCTRGESLHCDLGLLPVGASARVVVSIHLDHVNHGTVFPHASAPEPDGNPFDNTTTVAFSVLNCSILGTFGADTLYGTPGRDHICARFGDDRIYGNAGNDVIEGGEGADTIYGGKGRDVIYGGGGEDVVLARDGQRDVIDCGPQKDVAVVDRIDVVSHCRTVYKPKPKA